MEIWGMRSITSLPLLPGQPGPEAVVLLRVLIMGQIEFFNHLTVRKQMIYIKWELLVLNSHTWNHLIVCKQMINT